MPDLSGKKVLVTRPRRQAEEFIHLLKAAGAQPVCFPVIEISPVPDPKELDRALSRLESFDWLVLTSVNGVHAVWARLAELGIHKLPGNLKVAAIGPQTASALQSRGVLPNFVPDEYVAEAILPGLGEVAGKRVLLTRADLARPFLAEAIRSGGGEPLEITAYQTLPAKPEPEGLQALREGLDFLTFTSSSTVRNFIALVRRDGLDPLRLASQPKVACIGPITAETARDAGFHVDIMAKEYTVSGLFQALVSA